MYLPNKANEYEWINISLVPIPVRSGENRDSIRWCFVLAAQAVTLKIPKAPLFLGRFSHLTSLWLFAYLHCHFVNVSVPNFSKTIYPLTVRLCWILCANWARNVMFVSSPPSPSPLTSCSSTYRWYRRELARTRSLNPKTPLVLCWW